MGHNEQNQYFAELRQKVCLYIHLVVLLTFLPSLDGKHKRFVTKNGKRLPTRVRQTIVMCDHAAGPKTIFIHNSQIDDMCGICRFTYRGPSLIKARADLS